MSPPHANKCWALLAIALVACTKTEIQKPRAPRGSELELLTGGAAESDRLPIIVALHGLGDRPESFAHVFDAFHAPARVIVPRAPEAYGQGYRWFASRTQDGDEPLLSRELAVAVNALARSIEELHAKHGVRPIVTGFSQGAMLSYALAAKRPDLIEAAIPIAGWLPAPLWPEGKPVRAPIIRALHGTHDPVVPLSLDQRTCDRLKELGFDVELTTFEGIDHTVTPEMHRLWLELLAKSAVQ